ncbi:MAG: hemerythrin family protein, partial [Proteobacteria bacterium]|nr:hemerythrin family protein [Pseudomonadota bacterium]
MHPLIEKEHQQLIDLLDALDKCISTGNSANQVHKYLSDFVALAEEHFRNEEAIMETYKYTEIIDHKKEHA